MRDIKYIVSDIDGVLTDGTVSIDENGNERKSICFRDLDAIGIGRRIGLEFVFATGESSGIIDCIVGKFGVSEVFRGAKDKLSVLQKICNDKGISMEQICYIGDADRDVEAIQNAGFGVAPCDGAMKPKSAADYVTIAKGGYGVLLEVVNKLEEFMK